MEFPCNLEEAPFHVRLGSFEVSSMLLQPRLKCAFVVGQDDKPFLIVDVFLARHWDLHDHFGHTFQILLGIEFDKSSLRAPIRGQGKMITSIEDENPN